MKLLAYIGLTLSLGVSASNAECVGSDFACARIREVTAARNAEDDAKCRSLGAKPGTRPYVECRLVLDQKRDAYDANRRQENMQQADIDEARRQCRSQGLIAAGTAMMQGQPVPYRSCP
jgi:hypothetical protein